MLRESSPSSSDVLKWFVFVTLTLAVLAAGIALYLNRFSPVNRTWVVTTLENRYDCDVELGGFNASLFPKLNATGRGLVLKPRHRTDLPPLASIRLFSISGDWPDLLRRPRHFRQVRLEGLVLNIPPRRGEHARKNRRVTPFVLDEVIADGTILNILSSKAGKPPHVFEIHKLRLQSAGPRQGMPFQALLRIPRPVGEVQSNGQFGPWISEEPALTPVSGSYMFSDADLSTIRGIAGILSSQGRYEGVLGRINVLGATDTPNFSLGIGRNAVHLKTEFTAIVDGTNGDTLLEPVKAEIGQSEVAARGSVEQSRDRKGRKIQLDAGANPARLEDLLRLAVKSSTPPMIGGVNLHTRLRIFPGSQDLIQRLQLEGGFAIRTAEFTNLGVQEKVTSLSQRGKGEHGGDDSGKTAFNMRGHFVLRQGSMTFSTISFDVPGASVQLHGAYSLLRETLDFEGMLRLQVKLSQTTTGVKSFFLKPIDPLFERRGAGAVLPIKVTGTREQPRFGLELGKALKGSE